MRHVIRWGIAALLAFGALTPFAQAASYYWDANGADDGVGGSGVWNTTSPALWRSGSDTGSLVVWPTTGTDIDPYFTGTAGTLTIDGSVRANDIYIKSNGYLIQGGTLTATYSNPYFASVDTGCTATISSTIAQDGYFGGALYKKGTGTLIYSGNNLFSAAMKIDAGTLIAAHNNALGTTAGSTTVANGAALVLANGVTVAGEDLGLSGNGGAAAGYAGALTAAPGANAEWAGSVTLGSTYARVGAQTGGTLTLSGVIQDGAVSDIEIGSTMNNSTGFTVISGTANTYTGATLLLRGILKLGAQNALPTGTTLDVHNVATADRTVFDLNGFNQTVAVLKNTATGGTVTNSNSETAATLTVNGSADGALGSVVAGNLNLVKSGAGTLTLSGINTFTGSTAVDQGTLKLGGQYALRNSTFVGGNGSLIFDGAVAEKAFTFGGLAGASDLALTNDASEALALSVGYNNAETTYSGSLGGAGSLTKIGSGSLTLDGANGHSGLTTVSSGALVVANSAALGTADAGTVVGSGGSLRLQGGISVADESLFLSGFGPGGLGALQNISGDNTWSGDVTLGATSYNVVYCNAGSLTIAGDVYLTPGYGITTDGQLLVKGPSSSSNVINVAITGDITGGTNGTYAVWKSDSNYSSSALFSTLTLSGTNSYLGTTALGYGTLAVSGGAAIPDASQVFFASKTGAAATTFDLLDSEIIGSLSSAANSTQSAFVNLHGNTLTTGGDNNSTTFRGVIYGSGGNLVKTGSGAFTLTAVNTYTGSTAINDGSLIVDGSIAASSGVGIAEGAVLAGSGFVSVISGAGLVNPGNSPGILTAASIDPSAGTDFAFELTTIGSPDYSNAAASLNDVLRLTSLTAPTTAALTADNVIDLYFGVESLSAGDAFLGGFYVDAASDASGLAAMFAAVKDATYNYYVLGDGAGTHSFGGVSYYTLDEFNLANSTAYEFAMTTVADAAAFAGGAVSGGVMQFAVVPEPGAMALLAFGLLGLIAYAWRRRK